MVRRLTDPVAVSSALRLLGPDLISMAEEIGLPKLKSVAFMAERWAQLITTVGRAYVWEFFKAPRGILLGLISRDTIYGKLTGYECIWGVVPQYRGHAVKLLKAFEIDCKAAGCEEILSTATAGPSLWHMEQLYSKLGYSPRAVGFSKAL